MSLPRIWRHWIAGFRPARRLLPVAELGRIEAEITKAELNTEGEIRVAIETALSLPQLWHGLSTRARALQVFANLGVWDTPQNNGVLIYVLLADRCFEIVADRAIAERVPQAEWTAVCAQMTERFHAGDTAEACCLAVRGVAQHLAQHFAVVGPHRNELPNQPILL